MLVFHPVIKLFFKVLRDQALSDYFVVYLRLMVSNYLQQNAEFFSAFIEGQTSMKDFCSHVSVSLYFTILISHQENSSLHMKMTHESGDVGSITKVGGYMD